MPMGHMLYHKGEFQDLETPLELFRIGEQVSSGPFGSTFTCTTDFADMDIRNIHLFKIPSISFKSILTIAIFLWGEELRQVKVCIFRFTSALQQAHSWKPEQFHDKFEK